jgi:hypothetical protein
MTMIDPEDCCICLHKLKEGEIYVCQKCLKKTPLNVLGELKRLTRLAVEKELEERWQRILSFAGAWADDHKGDDHGA